MPDRRQEVILADHAITVPDQVNEKIEDLRLDRHKVGSPPELAAIRVERTLLEQIAQNFIPLVARRPAATLAQPCRGNMEGTLRQNGDDLKDLKPGL